MKWVLVGLGILLFGLCASYVWAGRELKPLDETERARAPGQFAELPDGKIHYRLSGPEGAPLIVMVHGFSTPAFIFEQNAAALREAGFRVLQFDHFGRGWSDRPSARYDMDFYDRELLGLLDALSITEHASFVGLSMGGPIVAEFAVRHPERVARVFLLVPAGFDVAGTDGVQASLIRTPVIGDWLWRVVALGALTSDPQYDEVRPRARRPPAGRFHRADGLSRFRGGAAVELPAFPDAGQGRNLRGARGKRHTGRRRLRHGGPDRPDLQRRQDARGDAGRDGAHS